MRGGGGGGGGGEEEKKEEEELKWIERMEGRWENACSLIGEQKM